MGDLGIFNLDIIGFRSDLKFLRLLKLRLMLLLMLIENIRPSLGLWPSLYTNSPESQTQNNNAHVCLPMS